MNHPIRIFIWAICGLILAVCASLVPAHFRAVDIKVIESAGAGTPSIVQSGINLLNLEKPEAARILAQAAAILGKPGHDQLSAVIARAARFPWPPAYAKADPVFETFAELFRPAQARPIIEPLLEGSTREKLIEFLKFSRRPGVVEILNNRLLTNTVQFPPATSAAGQPLDAVIVLSALLSQTDQFATGLREKIEFLATHANGGGSTEALETVYLDLLALGNRLEWPQLTEFIRRIEDTSALHDLAESARTLEEKLPIFYAAVVLSETPQSVAKYLAKFPKSGMNDIGLALSDGKGALQELLHRKQQIYAPKWRLHVIGYDPFGAFFYAVLPWCRAAPWGGLILRGGLFFVAAFCLARALGSMALDPDPHSAPAAEPDHTRLVQDIVLAICLFSVALLVVEPFIVSQISETPQRLFPIRLQLPMAGGAVASQLQKTIQPVMSIVTLASLLAFFVLQALVYIWCLAKISEIRRQPVGPRMKLRLLENEEHLFDAGLYLGLVGTIVSLIVFSLGIVKPSLMAAYSSTSFGIIFVCILKVFHVRPLRRTLILESEPQS
ncbi:MAG: hypothetical protein L0Z50_16470 [Verrucomicrobiales bacterium]|nr:hypothetical protein [Verrucomicrobiales bacterium]